jgi:AmmeMemoRadiSam system protein A
MPLADDVREHAVAAAVEDFRFSPVRPDEVSSIEVEISVLTPPRPLRYELVDELLGKLRPGIDGVILESGYHRATFLPQVWDKVPDPEAFLGMLCEKAGLAYDAWRKGDLRVSTYQVESFHEHPRPVS